MKKEENQIEIDPEIDIDYIEDEDTYNIMTTADTDEGIIFCEFKYDLFSEEIIPQLSIGDDIDEEEFSYVINNKEKYAYAIKNALTKYCIKQSDKIKDNNNKLSIKIPDDGVSYDGKLNSFTFKIRIDVNDNEWRIVKHNFNLKTHKLIPLIHSKDPLKNEILLALKKTKKERDCAILYTMDWFLKNLSSDWNNFVKYSKEIKQSKTGSANNTDTKNN